MIVPGSNLLNMAMSVLQKQTFMYMAYEDRAYQDNGMYVPDYACGVTVQGSVQPVARTLYERMGLDFQRNYSKFYVPQNITDVKRASAGDRFYFNNKLWQVLSNVEWFGVDGWDEVLSVQIPMPNNFYTTETGFAYVTEDGKQFYTTEY